VKITSLWRMCCCVLLLVSWVVVGIRPLRYCRFYVLKLLPAQGEVSGKVGRKGAWQLRSRGVIFVGI